MNIEERLLRLESTHLISNCMKRYMSLCDHLGNGTCLNEVMALFTDDAVWQGVGKRYEATFGLYKGRESIRNMFQKYDGDKRHFLINRHLLTNEVIEVNGELANGRWTLLQPATFMDGRSQLSCASIDASFIFNKKNWQINLFQTESVFNRPVDKPWDDFASLPVPK